MPQSRVCNWYCFDRKQFNATSAKHNKATGCTFFANGSLLLTLKVSFLTDFINYSTLLHLYCVFGKPLGFVFNNLGIHYVAYLGGEGVLLMAQRNRLRQNTSNSFIIILPNHRGHAH